jgi:large subunit ribosomal protein L15
MKLTEILKAAGADKRRKRVGRGHGSGHGGTSCRGHKGGGSRSGYRTRGLAEGGAMPHFRRLPKRGFNNFNFTEKYAVVNVGDLNERFEKGAHVTPQALVDAGLIRNLKMPVKVLGTGELSKKLVVDAARYSASAIEKINKAGGEARVSAAMVAAKSSGA